MLVGTGAPLTTPQGLLKKSPVKDNVNKLVVLKRYKHVPII